MGRRTRSQEWCRRETFFLMEAFCEKYTGATLEGYSGGNPSLSINNSKVTPQAIKELTEQMSVLTAIARRIDEMAKGKHRKEWE